MEKKKKKKKHHRALATVVLATQEDHSSRPAQANSSQDSTSKITRAKGAGGAVHMVACLLCRSKAQLEPQSNQK
jgi:hypothetical protein